MKNVSCVKISLLVLVMTFAFACHGWASDATGLSERTNLSWWVSTHDGHVNDLQSTPADILFLGDSITDWWDRVPNSNEVFGLVHWTNYYVPRNAYNAGIQGDKVEDLRWRVENGLFSSSNDPKVVVMLIGVNGYDDTETNKVAGMRMIADFILTNTVTSELLVLGTFPHAYPIVNTRTQTFASLSEWAPDDRITILNINDAFLADSTTLNTNLFVDNLHPNEQGYGVWYTNMEPTLVSLLDSGPAIVTSESSLTIAEGSTNAFNIRLAEMPENTATVTVSRVSGDTNLSVLSGSPAVFTTNNWDVWQPITLQAAEDADTDNGSATFQCSGDSLTATQITATESENDIAIQVANSSLTVPEGSTANLLVRLNTDPPSDYTVSVSRVSGDTNLSVSSGAQLIFTAGDYMNWQTSVVAAAQDDDEANGSAIIRLSSVDAADVDVTVTEQDDDNTVVATGLLAAWNLDNVSDAAVVTSTNAYFMATGLLNNATAGALMHSHSSEQRTTANALAAIDNDEATISAAITADNYFYWNLEAVTNHAVTITQIVYRTDNANPVPGVLLSDKTGITSTNILATNATGLALTTVDLSSYPALSDISSAVEFRIYGYGAGSQYDRYNVGNDYAADGLDDIQVYGSVAYSAPGTTSVVVEIQTSTNALALDEGSSATFHVRLSDEPAELTTVSVARTSGDTDVSISSGITLVFTTNNWDTWQTVTIAAAEDGDFTDDTAVIRCSADGMSDQDVSVTVTDNDSDQTYILPFFEPFEAGPTNAGGIGALNGQHGWAATGATVQGTTYYAGTQACSLASGGMTHTFEDAQTNVTVTFYAQPFFGQTNGAPAADDTAVFWFNTNGNVIAYSGAVAQVSSDPVSVMGWRKIEVALDYGAGQWDLTVDDTNVFSDLAFYSAQSAFAHLHIEQAETNETFVDSINIDPADPSTPSNDSDGDGMPDDWELTYSGSITGFMPYADHDGDGMPNIHEFIANTVPTNSDSLFVISDVAAETGGGNYVITWDSVSGRVYGISWGTNLSSGFAVMTTNIPALPPQNVYTDETHSVEESGYYRIDVKMAE